MVGLIRQPPLTPGPGWLCKEQSHLGYVTNDMDRAVAILAERYGLANFSFMGGPMPQGGEIKVAFAWAGGQIYEIICASGPGTEFYNEVLPQGEFAIRFHHNGFVIEDDAGWRGLEQELADTGWPIAYSTLTGTFIDAYYIKAPELGHCLEYVRPFQAGLDFYAAVPAN
jgi:hypothetical protein